MNTNKLLTPAQVAERTSLSKQYIYILIREGKLPSVRFGRKALRVSESALEEFIESRSTTK